MIQISTAPIEPPLQVLKDEPMVFSADMHFAVNQGGNLTDMFMRQVRRNIGLEVKDVVIDTRVHMLKEGWNPSIAGWHCDAIPRNPETGQPDVSLTPEGLCTYLAIIDMGTGSLTEFYENDNYWAVEAKPNENYWAAQSKNINTLLKDGVGKVNTVESGHLYRIGPHEYHRSVPATGSGWRFFFRATVNSLHSGPYNEVRKQVQVYLPSADSGW